MGWFANLIFGRVEPQMQGKGSEERTAWGVETDANYQEQTPKDNVEPPEVDCIRVEPHISSDMTQLELWICLMNSSDSEIEIARIECLGRAISPSRFLKPGEQHEIQIYRGSSIRDDTESTAHITYKLVESGDYYRGEYYIKYKYSQHEGADLYTPYEFDLQNPVAKI